MNSEPPTRLYESQEELLNALCAYRDHALVWVGDLVAERQGSGIGAAITAFDRLQERVERLQDRMSSSAMRGGSVVIIPPWSPWADQETDDIGTAPTPEPLASQ